MTDGGRIIAQICVWQPSLGVGVHARTAGALDSITRWIEKTEDRMSSSERGSAERQERATNVIADAIKTMGERIAEIERRSLEAQQPRVEQRRDEPALRDIPRSARVLARIQRRGLCDDLAPAVCLARAGADDDDLAHRLSAERRRER